MNARTLYLLIGAGIVGLLYFGDQAYRQFVEAPMAARDKELQKIEKAIENANQLIAQKLSVEKQLDYYEKMSLPYDVEITRPLYQGWLLELVSSIGFKGTSVDAAAPRQIAIKRQKPKRNQSNRKTVLVRYGYSLRCRGSLQQVVTFLYRFYRSGHLHKIRSMTLNPSSGGAVIDAVFSIEALSLLRTERDNQLTSLQVNRLKQSDEQYYSAIARRNFFSKTGSGILNNVRVTGITFGTSGKPQLWLKTKPGQPTRVVENDEVIELDSHRLEVLDIQSDLVLFLVDGKPVKVGIGETIAREQESVSNKETSSEPKKDLPANSTSPKNGKENEENKNPGQSE